MESILSNKALLIPLGAWCVAQALKVLISLIRDRRLNLPYFVSMGGMPSAHSTLVCALAATIAITRGLDSIVFAIAAFFAAIVMYDAAGVRQTVSTQSTILNSILDELFKGKPAYEKRLRELIGHTKFEIIAGVALGILLAWWWT
ncbi:MAG TPA: divergent PAP2 family protein [Dehalococcoidia bacterium]|nr:divergent PAP2 family protein [Dehalococcoidia bacterium]